MGANSSLCWAVLHDILLVAQSPGAPTDDHWRQYIDDINSSSWHGVLVSGYGNKLTVSQRSDVERVLKRNHAKLALVSDSSVTRGVLTALGWLGLPVKAFAPTNVEDALGHLGLQGEQRNEAQALLAQLQTEVLSRLGAMAARG